jgi:acetyl esterase/lipase
VPAGAVPADAPPAFFLVASDDPSHAKPVLDQVSKYEEAKRPVEVHITAKGGHGFGMGTRSKFASVRAWPQRLSEWLADSGILEKAAQ